MARLHDVAAAAGGLLLTDTTTFLKDFGTQARAALCRSIVGMGGMALPGTGAEPARAIARRRQCSQHP